MTKSIKKIGAAIFLVILSIVVGLAFFIALINLSYRQRILPRVFFSQHSFGGLAVDATKGEVQAIIDNFGSKIILTHQGKSWTIDQDDIDLKFDASASSARLIAWGRDQSLAKGFWQQLRLIIHPVKFQADYSLDQKKLKDRIGAIAGEINIAEKDAWLQYQNSKIISQSEIIGQKLDENKLYGQIIRSIAELNNINLDLPVSTIAPRVYLEGLTVARTKVQELTKQDLLLQGANQSYSISGEQIMDWLDFYASNIPAVEHGYLLEVNINQAKVKTFLTTLAKDINNEPENAKLTIENGKVSIFQPAKTGYRLNEDKAFQMMAEALANPNSINNKIDLPIEKQEPEVSDKTISSFGIKELIGKATTSFKGSPSNRVHNIENGTQALTGLLIKPDEEFSVVKKLGAVNGESGYLPELVIKENKTIPEYGGGLCQVSTTLFRAVLSAGLPVIERQNHSYRVSYYEPPVGLDATVYLPKPDLKFKNDTPGYLLIQSEIKDNSLTFEFYGTADGRVAKIEGPYVSGYVNPPNPIYTETDSLPRGETKQIEKAHQGASATAYYRVFNKDGSERHSQVFKSKYRAWAAQFLVGTAESAPAPPENQPTP